MRPISPPADRSIGFDSRRGAMNDLVKWGVVALSLIALGKLGLARRAGHVLRALLSRFGVLLVALSAVMLPTTFAPNAAQTAEAAQTGACSKVIPVDAMADVVMGTGTGAVGAFVTGTGASLTAPVAVGAGTAAPAAAAGTAVVAPVVGTVALAAAVFLGSVWGTCKFLDWVTGDINTVDDVPLYGEGDIVTTRGLCSVVAPTLTAETTDVCVRLVLPGALPSSWTFFVNDANGCPHSGAGVSIPCVNRSSATDHLFSTPYSGSFYNSNPWYYSNPVQTYNASLGTWCPLTVPSSSPCGNTSVGTETVVKLSCPDITNIGGACGYHPQMIFYGGKGAIIGDTLFSPVLHLMPEWRKGWQRHLLTDVECDGSGGGWVRGTSAAYRDGEVTARIKTPTCPPGTEVKQVRTWRVPVGVSCAIGATLCYHARAKVFEFVTPPEWIDGTDRPEWASCVIGDTNCGTPVLSAGVCSWGGITVDVGFCEATNQAGRPTQAGTMPKLDDIDWIPEHVPGAPIQTAIDPNYVEPEPPEDGGIEIPIDPGTGQNTVTPSDGGDEPCVPTGWGWMNPVEWVLKPVKCAMVWAFVPDQDVIAEAWDGLMLDAETNVPIAWVYKAHELVADASAGAGAAVASTSGDCFTVIPEGGDLVDSDEGEICPATMAIGPLSAARPWLGFAVWLFWAWSMYGVLFRKAAASTEPEQLSLF